MQIMSTLQKATKTLWKASDKALAKAIDKQEFELKYHYNGVKTPTQKTQINWNRITQV